MSRANIVFAALLVMLGALALSLVARSVPVEFVPADPAPSASASASTPQKAPSRPTGSGHPAETKVEKAVPRGTPLGRTLRVTALSWPLLAAGVVQNAGLVPSATSEFGEAGLAIALSRSTSMSEVEHALARGGADEKGADIALIALPEFSASYDTLRALDPVMFLVVAWSHGKHVVLGNPKPLKLLTKVARVSVRAEAGAPETFLATLGLELSGVSPDRIDLLPPSEEVHGRFVATTSDKVESLPEAFSKNQFLSTAVAVRAIPYVAVAQRSLLEKHETALVSFARLWLEGLVRVQKDAPSAAREVAKLDEALEPLDLLDQLGKLQPSTDRENARLFREKGSADFGLAALFARDWNARLKMKLVTSPAPDRPVVSGNVAALLVAEDDGETAPGAGRNTTAASQTLFSYDPGKLDQNALVSELAFLANVFGRSHIKLAAYSRSMFDEALSKTLVERTVTEFSVSSEQLTPEKLSPHSLSPYRISISQAR